MFWPFAYNYQCDWIKTYHLFVVVVFYFYCFLFSSPSTSVDFEYLKFHFISTIGFLYLFIIFLVIALGFTVYMHTCVLSHIWLFETQWTVTHQTPLSMWFPRQEYWSGLPLASPGIFLTQVLNPRLLHWQVDPLPRSHQGSTSHHVRFPVFLCPERAVRGVALPQRQKPTDFQMVLVSLGTGDGEGVLCCPGPASDPVTMRHGGGSFFSDPAGPTGVEDFPLTQAGPHMCPVGDRTHWPIHRPLKLLFCREEGLGWGLCFWGVGAVFFCSPTPGLHCWGRLSAASCSGPCLHCEHTQWGVVEKNLPPGADSPCVCGSQRFYTHAHLHLAFSSWWTILAKFLPVCMVPSAPSSCALSQVSMCVHVHFLLWGAFLSLCFIFFGCLWPQLSNDFKKVMMFLVYLTFSCWDEWGVLSSFQHSRGKLKSPRSYSDGHTKQQTPGPPDASCVPNEGKSDFVLRNALSWRCV